VIEGRPSVHHATTVMLWILAVLSAALLIYSVACMLSQRGAPATPLTLGRFWMGLFVLVETGPRLAGWPAWLVLVLSVLAFVPLLLAVKAVRRY
jgi:hypothetical protein